MLAEKIESPLSDSLIKAASILYHQKGYGKVRLSELARAAGITTKDFNERYRSQGALCLEVIEAYRQSQAELFKQINRNGNPRQRLSLYLDEFSNEADILVANGCPVNNLYHDVKRMDQALAGPAAELIRQRLDWVSEQFVLITKVERVEELPERLTSALHGIVIMGQATGNPRLIRTQINQLKSWIRSM